MCSINPPITYRGGLKLHSLTYKLTIKQILKTEIQKTIITLQRINLKHILKIHLEFVLCNYTHVIIHCMYLNL